MLNLKDKINERLSEDIKNILDCCSKTAAQSGFKIYLVGGVVRDLILGRDIFDIDITVEGDAVEFSRILEKKCSSKIKQIQSDLKTTKMVFENGAEIDFASTRKESYPKAGHMPVIDEIGSTLIDDVKRRDFTVNSLVLSLNQENFGEVIDYLGGLEDLNRAEGGQLRILHDKSFIDDPTRIIRGLKFSVRFGFKGFRLEEKTLMLQNEYLSNHLNNDICWSRVKSELVQTFSLNLPKAYDYFIEQGIYKLINSDFEKKIDSVLIKELTDKYKPENIWLVYLGAILYDSKCAECLGLNKTEMKILSDIQKLLGAEIPSEKFDIYKFFKGMALEAVLVYYLITQNLKGGQALLYLDELRHVKIHISGDDLIKLGLEPSEQFGEVFDAILKEKLEGNLTSLVSTEKEELQFAAEIIKELKN